MTRSGTRRAAEHPVGPGAGPAPLPEVYRRRRRSAVVLAGVLLLVAIGLTARVLLYDVGLADVEQVRVGVTTAAGTPVGGADTAVVTEQQLLDAAAVPLGGPLAALDTGAIVDRVGGIPAVAAVDVELDWPHTVVVRVVQRTPVAAVQTADGPAMVDATGAVFAGSAVPGLPGLAVAAPGPGDPSTLAGVGVLAALPREVRDQVLTVASAVDPSGVPGQVTLGLTDHREIRWGSPDRSVDKAAVLGPLLTQPGHLYDVTSPDLPTITR